MDSCGWGRSGVDRMTRFLIVTDTTKRQKEIIDKIEEIFADYYMDYEIIKGEVILSEEIEVTCLSLNCGTIGRPFDMIDYYTEIVDFGNIPQERIEHEKLKLLFARPRRWEKTKEITIKKVYELIKEPIYNFKAGE